LKKTAVFFLLAVIVAGFYFRVDYQLQRGPALEEAEGDFSVPIKIERGSSLREIATQLQEEGIIRSRRIFEIYVLLNNYQGNLQAGTYIFSDNDDLLKVVDTLKEGETASYRITIPEGFTVEEIIERVSNVSDYSQEEVEEALTNSSIEREYFPGNDEVKYQSEGFLFPDTYIIPYDFTPEEIFQVMVTKFENKWLSQIENQLEKREAAEKNLSVADYVTIASLIEKEANLATEKPRIAGVIYNRLEQDMRLQLDASVQYALPDRVTRVLYSHLEVDSSYNTYRNDGLPPGPIASPGDESLKAALEPEENDYLFYFARPDGSHIFTSDYQEHLRRQREEL